MPAPAPDASFRTRDGVVFRYRAAAIIARGGQVLLVGNERNDYLYSVGGGVQVMETSREALLRELREETGWELQPGPLAVIHENFFTEDSGERWHELAFYYWVEVPEHFEPSGQSVTMSGVAEHLRWVDVADLDRVRAYPTWLRTELARPRGIVRHLVTHEGGMGAAGSGDGEATSG